MLLTLRRIAKKDNYTIGHLYIDGEYFCDTIEDKDRGLTSSMSLEEIKTKKIHGETAIPIGEYIITLDITSAKYSKSAFFRAYANNGKLPRLLGVKGYEGILIHTGNTAKDSEGCIIIGENKIKGQVINSQDTFKKFYPLLQKALKKHDTIKIKIE